MIAVNLADDKKPPERAKRGPLLAWLAAVLIGRRPEDKAVQKRAAKLAGGGFAVYAAIWGFSMVKDSATNDRADHAADRAADREVIREVAVELRSLTAELRDREKRDEVWRQAILDQLAQRPAGRAYIPKPLPRSSP